MSLTNSSGISTNINYSKIDLTQITIQSILDMMDAKAVLIGCCCLSPSAHVLALFSHLL